MRCRLQRQDDALTSATFSQSSSHASGTAVFLVVIAPEKNGWVLTVNSDRGVEDRVGGVLLPTEFGVAADSLLITPKQQPANYP
jgi:hypothetical protein